MRHFKSKTVKLFRSGRTMFLTIGGRGRIKIMVVLDKVWCGFIQDLLGNPQAGIKSEQNER